MQAIATQKFMRITPRKLRYVAYAVRGMKALQAVEMLPHAGKLSAAPLAKVINTAVANAVVKGANPDTLVISELQVNEGPRLKGRGNFAGRGRYQPVVKRMSHVRVVVEEEKVDMPMQVDSKKTEKSKKTKGAPKKNIARKTTKTTKK